MAKRILIIEDDIFFSDMVEKKLKHAGYETFLATDGLVGMKRLRELLPDLVLLDVAVSTVSGYKILEEKLRDQKISNIPTIVFSNSGEIAEVDKILSLGVEDYLVKSKFDPEDLIEKVKLQLNVQGKRQDDEKKETHSPSGLLKDRKIVWVEDDVFLSEILTKKLLNQGCKFFHEMDGEVALQVVEREMPDIVVLDILLSGIDGFEILKRLKQNEKIKKIPVMMLSNLGQQSDIEKAKTLGAERFLIKATASLDEIVEAIRKIVEKK